MDSLSQSTYARRLRFEALEDRRLLASVTVSNVTDVVNGDTTSIAALVASNGGDGISLREAVLAANSDAAADTIDFASSATGNIQLTNVGHVGQIAISNNLTINGPGSAVLTIRAFAGTSSSGDGARIFAIDNGSAATFSNVSIGGLTLTGGDRAVGDGLDGGAVLNNENLTINGCAITGNRLSGSSGWGGGIFSQLGSLTVTASTISGNTCARGGGIYVAGPSATISGTTISGNMASASSGNGGGGIAVGNVAGSTTTIVNSTISSNQATSANGGGILNGSAGSLTVRHSTITLNRAIGNGGGIHSNFATTSLDQTIVAGNLRSGTTRSDLSGSATAIRYSLIGDNTSATITNNGGNQIGTGTSPINALLGPLANNGGPTLTHALLAGSPAIDAGDPAAVAGVGTVPLQDQRGAVFVRVAVGGSSGGARIDIGAYERQTLPGLNLVVDTLADENDQDYSAGDLALREAIDLANGSVGSDTISFAAALTSSGPATILLSLGQLAITDALAINGPGASLLTISAYDPTPTTKNGDGNRIFNIDDGNASNVSNVSISGLTLTGGDASDSGGAILSNENLTLTDSVVTGNASTPASTIKGGGGIYSGYGCDVTLVRCVITNNSSADEGGGIRKRGGHLVIQDSQIEGNTAGWVGGGVSAADGAMVDISDTDISSNASLASVSYGGGGLFFYNAGVLVRNSLISGNSSLFTGGAIEASITTLSVIGSTLSGNTSASYGGALHSVTGSLQIAFSTITANMAPAGFSGGIYVTSGNAASRVIRSSIVAGNANSDLDGDATLFQSAGYNLIGTGSGTSKFNQTGDQVGIVNPMLGVLAYNGGPTKTHLPLSASPAIDAGDPAAVAGVNGVPLYDQRGNPYARVWDGDGVGGGRIDIGAAEVQTLPLPRAVYGDYNGDGAVDGGDYVLSRKTMGTNVAPYSGADGSGNGVVGSEDYDVWRAHYGDTIAAGSGAVAERLGDGLAEPVARNEVGGLFRISDFGFRIGEGQESRVESLEPEVVLNSSNLEDAVLALLASVGQPGDVGAPGSLAGSSESNSSEAVQSAIEELTSAPLVARSLGAALASECALASDC